MSASENQLNACKAIDQTIGNSPCFDSDAITANGKPIEGNAPKSFFSQTNKNFVLQDSTCAANPNLMLISSSQVLAEYNCNVNVNFTRDFTSRVVRVTQVPVYEDVELNKTSCYDQNGRIYCSTEKVPSNRIVGYENQKIETEGSVFAAQEMKSQVSFRIQVVGTLDGDGTFTAR